MTNVAGVALPPRTRGADPLAVVVRPHQLAVTAAFIYFLFIYSLGLRWPLIAPIAPQFADEILAIALLPLLVGKLGRREVRASPLLMLSFIAVGAFVGMATQAPFLAVATQLLSALKTIVFLWTPLILAPKVNFHRLLKQAVNLLICGFILFEGLRYIAPGLHRETLGLVRQFAEFRAFGLSLPRAEGPLFHPGHLAAIAGYFSIYCFVNGLKKRSAVLAFMVLSSFQLLDTGLFIALMVAAALGLMKTRAVFRLAVGLVVAAVLLLLFYSFNAWNPAEIILSVPVFAAQEARSFLLEQSFSLALQHFPVGTGFGTFGGAGAAIYNAETYYALGFGNFWWFQDRLFLMDSGLAQVLGETGYLGTTLFGFSILAIGKYAAALCQNRRAKTSVWIVTCHLLLLTVASPAIYDISVLLTGGAVMAGLTRLPASAARGPLNAPAKGSRHKRLHASPAARAPASTVGGRFSNPQK